MRSRQMSRHCLHVSLMQSMKIKDAKQQRQNFADSKFLAKVALRLPPNKRVLAPLSPLHRRHLRSPYASSVLELRLTQKSVLQSEKPNNDIWQPGKNHTH